MPVRVDPGVLVKELESKGQPHLQYAMLKTKLCDTFVPTALPAMAGDRLMELKQGNRPLNVFVAELQAAAACLEPYDARHLKGPSLSGRAELLPHLRQGLNPETRAVYETVLLQLRASLVAQRATMLL